MLCPQRSATLVRVVVTSQGSHVAVLATVSLLLRSQVSVVTMFVVSYLAAPEHKHINNTITSSSSTASLKFVHAKWVSA